MKLKLQAAKLVLLPKNHAPLPRIWTLVGKEDAAVERLQEYRTALITTAVTAKIDVRTHSKTTTLTP